MHEADLDISDFREGIFGFAAFQVQSNHTAPSVMPLVVIAAFS